RVSSRTRPGASIRGSRRSSAPPRESAGPRPGAGRGSGAAGKPRSAAAESSSGEGRRGRKRRSPRMRRPRRAGGFVVSSSPDINTISFRRAFPRLGPGRVPGAPVPESWERGLRRRVSMRALRVSSPCLALQLLGFVAAAASFAQTAPEPPASIAAFVRSDPRLDPREAIQPLGETGAPLSAGFAAAWNAFLLDHGEWSAFVDARNGRVESAEGAGIPWIPGAGNRLTKDDLEVPLGAKAEPDLALLEAIARKFVAGNAELFGVEGKELRLAPGRSGHVSDALWLVDFDVVRGGLAIEGARLVFRVGHGNLIQLGSERLPPPDAAAPPVKVTREGAHAALAAFLGGFDPLADRFIDSGSIHLLPVAVADDRFADGFAFGKGYGLLAVWEISFRRDGVIGTWRGRVDATTGEVIELVDTNSYAQASGGVASDTAAGTEVVRPMPFADLGGGTFANTAGIYTFNGTPLTSTLNGKLARAADTCGAISLTTNANGNLPFGTAAGNNCTTPGVGGAG